MVIKGQMANNEIIKFRKRFKLSREDLASKLGVSAPTIWRWEKEISRPHKVLYDKLIKVMKRYITQKKGQ
jgi:DNA-binding XRE family transcriptional regulator